MKVLKLIGILLALAAPTLYAQDARDTTLATRIKKDLDSLARNRTAPSYSKRAQARIRANADSLLQKHGTVTPPPPTPTPAPPSASYTVTCPSTTCAFDASASIGARLTYAWACGAFPDCSSTTVRFSFTYPHSSADSTDFRSTVLTVTDSLGRTSVATKRFLIPPIGSQPPPPPQPDSQPTPPPPIDSTTGVIPAALPKSTPSLTPTKSTRTTIVPPGGDLQFALDNALPGDSVFLTPGFTWTGAFRIPARACNASAWTTLIGNATLPAMGIRTTPGMAAVYAKIVSPNNEAAIMTTGPICNWRFAGLEITGTLPQTSIQYGLVRLGDGGWTGGGETQTSLDKVPQNILVDHVYIHGSATLNSTRCLALNTGVSVVRDSWLSDCHAAGFDSQAIEGWNGPGPYLIENNYLEGAGENIMFGGADPGIQGLSPSDITIRRNHIVKPLVWKGAGWSIKNLFELKNARRVLLEANVMENSWLASQMGFGVIFKSSTDVCGTACAWQGTQDVTMRYNIVKNVHRALNLQAVDGATDFHTMRVAAEHNLFYEIGTAADVPPSDGWLMLLVGDLHDILIRRNTFVGNTPGYGLCLMMSAPGAQRLSIRDNICAGQSYYAISSDQGQLHTNGLNWYAGSTWQFAGNVVSQVDQSFWAANPVNNTYLTTIAQVGLSSSYSSVNYPNLGADISLITLKTQGVVVATPAGARRRAVARPVAVRLTRADSLRLKHEPKDTSRDFPIGRVAVPRR